MRIGIPFVAGLVLIVPLIAVVWAWSDPAGHAQEAARVPQLLRAVLLATGRELPDLLSEPEQAAFVPSHDAVDRGLAVAQGRVILVAEDNLINRKVIGHQLDLMGLASEQVGDGEEALARWRADPARYGLLLTDLHMPLLNGFDLTAAIRREEAPGRRLPVIALTANQMGSEDGRYLAAGMDGYLSKPVPLTLLQDTLRYWLTQTSAPSAAPPPPASTPNGFAAPPSVRRAPRGAECRGQGGCVGWGRSWRVSCAAGVCRLPVYAVAPPPCARWLSLSGRSGGTWQITPKDRRLPFKPPSFSVLPGFLAGAR